MRTNRPFKERKYYNDYGTYLWHNRILPYLIFGAMIAAVAAIIYYFL